MTNAVWRDARCSGLKTMPLRASKSRSRLKFFASMPMILQIRLVLFVVSNTKLFSPLVNKDSSKETSNSFWRYVASKPPSSLAVSHLLQRAQRMTLDVAPYCCSSQHTFLSSLQHLRFVSLSHRSIQFPMSSDEQRVSAKRMWKDDLDVRPSSDAMMLLWWSKSCHHTTMKCDSSDDRALVFENIQAGSDVRRSIKRKECEFQFDDSVFSHLVGKECYP